MTRKYALCMQMSSRYLHKQEHGIHHDSEWPALCQLFSLYTNGKSRPGGFHCQIDLNSDVSSHFLHCLGQCISVKLHYKAPQRQLS